jgi:hypothetical protein
VRVYFYPPILTESLPADLCTNAQSLHLSATGLLVHAILPKPSGDSAAVKPQVDSTQQDAYAPGRPGGGFGNGTGQKADTIHTELEGGHIVRLRKAEPQGGVEMSIQQRSNFGGVRSVSRNQRIARVRLQDVQENVTASYAESARGAQENIHAGLLIESRGSKIEAGRVRHEKGTRPVAEEGIEAQQSRGDGATHYEVLIEDVRARALGVRHGRMSEARRSRHRLSIHGTSGASLQEEGAICAYKKLRLFCQD